MSQPDWRYLDVTGTVAQFGQAFDVKYDKFTQTYNGSVVATGVGATTDLSVPTPVGNLVLGEEGADPLSLAPPRPLSGRRRRRLVREEPQHRRRGRRQARHRGERGPRRQGERRRRQRPVFAVLGPAPGHRAADGGRESRAVRGVRLHPEQLRSAYGLNGSGLSGKGQTVAEAVPASTSLEQDVNTWSAHVGTQPLRPGQLTVIGSPDGSGTPVPDSDPAGIESTMDVEAIHGMAPDADIVAMGPDTENWASLPTLRLYRGPRPGQHRGSFVRLFESPGMMAVYDQVFQEGATQGIGFYFSSGDIGNYAWPASSSWATGVGGTVLAIGANGKRLWETGWGDEQASLSADETAWDSPGPSTGAGGGKVAGQPQPWYQRGVVPSSLATGTDGTLDRVGADVAMDADGRTGMLVGGKPLDVTGNGTTYTEDRIGGTSLSAPLFAGVQALAQQAAGHRLGFANPEIYQRYDTPSFHDITKYTLPDGGYPAEAAQPLFTDSGSCMYTRGRFPRARLCPLRPIPCPASTK